MSKVLALTPCLKIKIQNSDDRAFSGFILVLMCQI